MRKIALAMIVACAVVSQSDARSMNAPFTLLHMGTNTCGSWVRERSTKSTQVFQAWVLGFLTAANMWANTDADLLHGIDGDSAFAWIDNFCRTHPLEDLGTAAIGLVQELYGRATGDPKLAQPQQR